MTEKANARLMDGDETLSPVDLPGSQTIGGTPLRWATVVIATATIFLFFTNAVSIDGWAKELAPGPLTGRLTELTSAWVEITDRVGLGAPRAAVHSRWKKAEAAKFGPEDAAGSP